jgi:hypothetical protein
MIWVEDERGQKGIYVFYADHHYDYFLDTWAANEPESDPSIVPPPGRVQPIRGFGKLWRSQPGVRERLGWALAPEQGFNTLYQDVSGFEWNNTCHYLQAINGSVIGMCRRAIDNWFFVAP